MIFPYSHEYGLTNDLRRRALLLADEVGVAAAAHAVRVSTASVYRWRRDALSLGSQPIPRRTSREAVREKGSA